MKQATDDFLHSRPVMKQLTVMEFEKMYATQTHPSSSHELLYVLDGTMTLHLQNNLEFRAVPGDILLVRNKTLHRDEFQLLRGLKILFIPFNWECEPYFDIVDNRTLIHLSYECKTEARRRIEYLRSFWSRNCTEEEKAYANDQLHSILLLFYFDQLKHRNQHAHSTAKTDLPLHEELASRARDFLRQNYAADLSLKATSAHLKVSAPYLSRIFHQELGICFSKYLTELRLNAARNLLLNSDLQVAEIANQCGFASSSYFIKVFNDHYGKTPKEFAALRFEKQ